MQSLKLLLLITTFIMSEYHVENLGENPFPFFKISQAQKWNKMVSFPEACQKMKTYVFTQTSCQH